MLSRHVSTHMFQCFWRNTLSPVKLELADDVVIPSANRSAALNEKKTSRATASYRSSNSGHLCQTRRRRHKATNVCIFIEIYNGLQTF